MKTSPNSPKTVDEYLAKADPAQLPRLEELRAFLRELLPQAEERISYGMPGYFAGKRPLVYFAAQKGHLGFYPTPSGVAAFAEDLKGYSTSKGCVRLAWDQPLPRELIRRIASFKWNEEPA